MLVGKVIGSVVSTRKCNSLVGSKFMIVEISDSSKTDSQKLVAIDKIGAGIGEDVLVATGSAARVGTGMNAAPVDAAIVGIIDSGAKLE
jgi:Carbon dioxide concentrating mechanism/carboxysome shell protein